jgi:hypothetical protein
MQVQAKTANTLERRCSSRCRAVSPHPVKTTTHRGNAFRWAVKSGSAAHRAANPHATATLSSRPSVQHSAKRPASFAATSKQGVAKHLSIKGKAQYNKAFPLRPSPEPPSNLALNRTRYGMPALGLHFIPAQARHAFAGRLALR